MSCEGCASRRKKLAAWIKAKLGLASVLDLDNANAAIADVNRKIVAVMGAGEQLESTLRQWVQTHAQRMMQTSAENTGRVQALDEQLDRLVTIINSAKKDAIATKALVRTCEQNVNEMALVIEAVEFKEKLGSILSEAALAMDEHGDVPSGDGGGSEDSSSH